MHKFYYVFLFFLLFSAAESVKGQNIFPPDSIKKTLNATKIDHHLKIDGKLDESAWKSAKIAEGFVQVEPFQKAKVNHETQIRLLYNQDFLYVGAVMHDKEGKKSLRVTSMKRDFEYGASDQFAIGIDGFNDQRNCMIFMTDPYSSQRDLLSADDTVFDIDWDGLWKVRTSRTDSGWVAEFAIPWQTLRYQKNKENTEQIWGINFWRNRRATNELSAWSPVPRAFSPSRVPYAGRLEGIEPPKTSGSNIRVQPYVLFSSDNYNGSEYYDKHNGSSVKVGGELKWAVTPNSLLDLTYNTDFAQADADRQVNNLSRLSIFFPERRQFFLENASLFGAGLEPLDSFWGGQQRIQPFFSRRIGLDGNGNPVPIDVGGRFVNRSIQRNYGVMFVRQRGNEDNLATNFFVGRYSQNIGKQNRIGYLSTIRNDADHSNFTNSIDGFFRLNASSYIKTMAMLSNSSNGKDNGFAGYYQFVHKGIKWIYWLSQSVVNNGFNPEMGFVSRPDVLESSTGGYWLNRGKWLPSFIRSFEPGVFGVTYHSATSGKLIERQVNLNPVWFSLQNGGGIGLFSNHFYQNVDYATTGDTLTILGVKLPNGDFNYDRFSIFMNSDASRKISFTFSGEIGKYYNGSLNTYGVSLNAAPIPHVSLEAKLTENYYRDLGINKETGNSQLYSISGRFAYNPRLQLIGFYQKSSINDLDVWNIRFSWEYKPLSFIYLVFNNRGFNEQQTMLLGDGKTRVSMGTLARQQEQHVIAKVSYLKQF